MQSFKWNTYKNTKLGSKNARTLIWWLHWHCKSRTYLSIRDSVDGCEINILSAVSKLFFFCFRFYCNLDRKVGFRALKRVSTFFKSWHVLYYNYECTEIIPITFKIKINLLLLLLKWIFCCFLELVTTNWLTINHNRHDKSIFLEN